MFKVLLTILLSITSQILTMGEDIPDGMGEAQSFSQVASQMMSKLAVEKVEMAFANDNFTNITNNEIQIALEHRIFTKNLFLIFAQKETSTAARLLEIIKEVKHGSDCRDKQLTYRALDGSNAFHHIIKKNVPCKIDSLLQLGKQAISQCNWPSEAAISKYNKFIRKIFMAQDNIDIGNTPLHYALSKDQIDIKLFKKITKHCPSAWQVASHEKITPFYMAEKNPKAGIFVFLHNVRLIKENTELIKKVLACFPMVVSVPDINGNTPIQRAAMVPEILSLFLDAGYAGDSHEYKK